MRRLALWTGIFLAFRLLCLWLFADGAWTPEEAYRGTVALEFRRALHGTGLRLPFWCHQADDYLGGSLVTAAITALNYEVFGLRLFALKLTALLFALGGLLFTFRFAEREFGARTANVFAALYTFAPPAFVFLGAVSMGYHTESVLFIGAMLLASSRLRRRPSGRDFLLLGFTGGFAFWFSNLNAVAFAASLAALPRESWKRKAALLAPGVTLGLAPWLARNAATGYSALHALARFFDPDRRPSTGPTLAYPLLKAGALLTRALPLSSGLPPFMAYPFFLALCVLAANSLRHLAPEWRRFCATYAVLFTALYAFSHFTINTASGDFIQFRYLQQLNVLLFLLSAQALANARAGAFLLIVVSLAGYAIADRGAAPPGRVWEYRPYSYPDLSAKVMSSCYKDKDALPKLLAWIANEPDTTRRASMSFPFVGAYDFAAVAADPPAGLPASDRAFAEGLGTYLGTRNFPPLRLLESASRFDVATQPFFWRGAAAGFPGDVPEELRSKVPPGWIAFRRSLRLHVAGCFSGYARTGPGDDTWSARGEGAAIVDCGITEKGAAQRAEVAAAGKSGAFRRDLAWGMGWRLRMRHLPDPLRARDRIAVLPAWAQAGAEEGSEAFARDYGLE